MATRRTENDRSEQTESRHAVKRRGLIAGAAALVAGMAMKQTAQPVAAASFNLGVGNDSFPGTALNGSGDIGTFLYFSLLSVDATPLTGTGSCGGMIVKGKGSLYGMDVYGGDAGSIGLRAQGGTGLIGSGSNGGTGVKGGGTTGVHGTSYNGGGTGTGVQGNGEGDTLINTTGFPMGVLGSVVQNGYGVYGNAGNGSGVYGVCTGGYGVGGIATTGTGVHGQSTSGTAIYGIIPGGSAANTVAISGTNNATAANSHGIVGVAGSGHGLVGSTNFIGGGPPYYAGLVGNAPNGAYAGLFYGKVSITGTLNGHTAVMQQAQVAVAHPDGSHRLTHSVSATDAWLEDVGEGTLTNGQADITIAPDFAAIADTGKYHIFLTAHGDYNLHVAEMKADGFVVRVTSGASNAPTTGSGPVGVSQVAKVSNVAGTFSWKVMAKRKDGQAQRLATYTFPNLTPPHIPDPPKAAEIKAKP